MARILVLMPVVRFYLQGDPITHEGRRSKEPLIQLQDTKLTRAHSLRPYYLTKSCFQKKMNGKFSEAFPCILHAISSSLIVDSFNIQTLFRDLLKYVHSWSTCRAASVLAEACLRPPPQRCLRPPRPPPPLFPFSCCWSGTESKAARCFSRSRSLLPPPAPHPRR